MFLTIPTKGNTYILGGRMMSVYASQRNESKAEFIRVAQELATYTLEQIKKFPKSYRFCLTNDIVRLAMEIHEDVLRANSIYIYKNMSESEFNLREEYFLKARSAIFALSSMLTITFSLVLKGNNFFGNKKKTSGIFKEWARLLNYEAALVKGIIESDKKRYKKYQNKNSNRGKLFDFKTFCAFLDYIKQEFWNYINHDNKSKSQTETKSVSDDDTEIVLPEETFDIE